MIAFTFDNTFEGLLCVVYDAYTRRIHPDALVGSDEIIPLTASVTHAVITNQAHYERVYRGLQKKLSPQACQRLQYAWLSEEPGADMALFRYIRKVFDARRPVENDLADPDIFAMEKLAKKVGREAQLLLGFVRFQKTADKRYAATISPRHNVLPLLLRHFAERFTEQVWLIYDIGRRYGVMHDAQGFHEVYIDKEKAAALSRNSGKLPLHELDPEEVFVQELWKTYFSTVAIQERQNPKLQARCMPRRFWKYLTEKQCCDDRQLRPESTDCRRHSGLRQQGRELYGLSLQNQTQVIDIFHKKTV